MKQLKQYLQSLRRNSSPTESAFHHELDKIREAHATANAVLEKAQDDLWRARESDAQSLAELQQQLRQIESDRAHARDQIEHLERLLADLEQGRSSTDVQVGSLQTMLVEERDGMREQVADVQRMLADAEQRHKSTEEHVDSLEAKLKEDVSSVRDRLAHAEGLLVDAEQHRKAMDGRMDSLQTMLVEERNSTRDQVAQVQRLLAGTEERQKSTEADAVSLGSRLDEERRRYEARLHAAEAGLARIQGEQQSALARQSELGNSFQGMVARLHELEQRADARPRRSPEMPAIIAALLLLAVILAGVFIVQRQQDRSRELAAVEQDVRDIRVFMEDRIDSQDAALNKLALALNRQETEAPPPAVEAAPAQAIEPQAADEQPPNSDTFVPDIRELQDALLTLGYDLGIAEANGELGAKTRQALQEFRQFYLPDSEGHDELISEPLVDLILKSADVSRADAARFNIRRDVLAAIRLGSTRTGVDFSFLMELARIESNFNPAARAPRSSATGLFQFRDPGWLEAIRTFGAEYGLQDYAAQVELIDDDAYQPGQIVRDPLQLKVLALRLNPRLSTLMMAESIKRNLRILSDRMGREPGRTDLYLAHFLGPDGALMFLEKLAEDPDAIAADLFPQKAESYPGVFLNQRQQQPRTVADVYRRFERQFTTARYTSGFD